MADRLQSTSLKDAVVDCICTRSKATHAFPLNMQRAIYPSSSNIAGIRRLLVDLAMQCWVADDLEMRVREPGMAESAADVAIALHRWKRDAVLPAFEGEEQEWCRYHEHREGRRCWRTMFPK